MDYFNFLSVVSLLKKKKSGRIKQSHFINVHCEICASYAWFCETKELKGVNNNVLHSYCLVFHLHHILAHEKTRKGLNSTSAAQFAVQPLVIGFIKTLRKGGAGLQKMFSAIRASVWSKNKGGGGGSRVPGPSPRSATERSLFSLLKILF